MQGKVVTKQCEFSTVQSTLLSGGALDCHSYCCIFTHRFMVMAVIEFGGLKELADASTINMPTSISCTAILMNSHWPSTR